MCNSPHHRWTSEESVKYYFQSDESRIHFILVDVLCWLWDETSHKFIVQFITCTTFGYAVAATNYTILTIIKCELNIYTATWCAGDNRPDNHFQFFYWIKKKSHRNIIEILRTSKSKYRLLCEWVINFFETVQFNFTSWLTWTLFAWETTIFTRISKMIWWADID